MTELETTLLIFALALALVAGAVKIGHLIAARYIKEHMPSLNTEISTLKKN